VSSKSKSSSRFNETVLTILHCGIHPVSAAPAFSSRFNETLLTIPCPPCPYLRPSLTRRCSKILLSSHYIVPVQRDGGHSSRLILRTCQVRLTSVSSGCASRSRILQMHPRQVRIAPASSKCASLSRVHVSSESTSLHQVHPPPPSSPPCPESCLSSMCASCQCW
jgi:hypothetical protein